MRKRSFKDLSFGTIRYIREKYSDGELTIPEISRILRRTTASVIGILTGKSHKYAGGPIVGKKQIVIEKQKLLGKQIILNIPGDEHDIVFSDITEAAKFCVTFKSAKSLQSAKSNIGKAIKNNERAYGMLWRLGD